ncbi:hypothetical protein [Aneurinibacillus aneurinilyticus]|jgi:hypothetical protein|uniref:Uncharacterized protein n=1 Tax=Aneurinibacillus aneurinilyticus TaxID=1391 RepID=A0A848CRC4_ANEAE|nr:hypothetical protein [Aneurinibacillus aneurinilyticus]NMF00005.1 hypothetical protein [Aneurinibacillus aneurinilyticus]
MAILPLKQTVTIIPASTENDWGEVVPGDPYTLKCRVQEGEKRVVGTSNNAGIHGRTAEEVVSVARFYFDKLAPVKHGDTLEYVNEAGTVYRYAIISIEIKRHISGKPILTVVSV